MDFIYIPGEAIRVIALLACALILVIALLLFLQGLKYITGIRSLGLPPIETQRNTLPLFLLAVTVISLVFTFYLLSLTN